MGLMRRFLSSFKPKQEEEKSTHFLQNGGKLLAELIAFSNGRYDIPIRSFSAKEITKATNNFAECVFTKNETVMFRGHLDGRQVLINNLTGRRQVSHYEALRDIVIASHMSHLKNVLKLVGCCLEFDHPASVYEYVGGMLLSDLLEASNNRLLLSWRSRIKIASDISSTVLYLHTAFPTPVIYRNLKPSKVMIDQYGVAKLFDFSLSISLPHGELFVVEDNITGTYMFIDPDYYRSSYVTQRTDVYSFGVFLLMLLTGKIAVWNNHGGKDIYLPDYVKHYADNHQYEEFIDPRILEDEGGVGRKNMFRSFLDLTLMCTQNNEEDKPEMIDVAKQLRLIEKGILNHLPSINS